MNLIKMAPKREGQEEIWRVEERMHFILGQIGECDRVLRQAKDVEKRMAELRKELSSLADEYSSFTVHQEGA